MKKKQKHREEILRIGFSIFTEQDQYYDTDFTYELNYHPHMWDKIPKDYELLAEFMSDFSDDHYVWLKANGENYRKEKLEMV